MTRSLAVFALLARVRVSTRLREPSVGYKRHTHLPGARHRRSLVPGDRHLGSVCECVDREEVGAANASRSNLNRLPLLQGTKIIATNEPDKVYTPCTGTK